MEDMQKLGNALRRFDAHVTLINLTNVIQADRRLKNARDYAERLALLPVTEYAPILTTSNLARPNSEIYALGEMVPFFGVNNLAAHGGSTGRLRPGAAIRRQYPTHSARRADALDRSLYGLTAKKHRPEFQSPAIRHIIALALMAQYGPHHTGEICGRLFPGESTEISA